MSTLAQRLADAAACGVFHLAREPYEIERAAREAGLALHRVDIHAVHGKADFLALLAKALAFPDWFGGNWDALADCLTDLSWQPAPGYVLVLEKAKHFGSGHAEEFAAAIEILQHAADYWRDEGKPFWVFIHGAQGWDSGLPKWPSD